MFDVNSLGFVGFPLLPRQVRNLKTKFTNELRAEECGRPKFLGRFDEGGRFREVYNERRRSPGIYFLGDT